MAEVTSEDIQALTASIVDLNQTITDTFSFDLEYFLLINGTAMVIFVTAVGIGFAAKKLKSL